MSEKLNPFTIAQAQLDEAAEVLQLDPDMHAFLRQPMREFHFTIPVRMDDGHERLVMNAGRPGHAVWLFRCQALATKMVFAFPAFKDQSAAGTDGRFGRHKLSGAHWTKLLRHQVAKMVFEIIRTRCPARCVPDALIGMEESSTHHTTYWK